MLSRKIGLIPMRHKTQNCVKSRKLMQAFGFVSSLSGQNLRDRKRSNHRSYHSLKILIGHANHVAVSSGCESYELSPRDFGIDGYRQIVKCPERRHRAEFAIGEKLLQFILISQPDEGQPGYKPQLLQINQGIGGNNGHPVAFVAEVDNCF